MLLLPCAGLYGFGTDLVREAATARTSPMMYLQSSEGSIYAALLPYFLVSGLCLLPLISWLATSLGKAKALPTPIAWTGSLAAYLLIPFGILPSRIMLRKIHAIRAAH